MTWQPIATQPAKRPNSMTLRLMMKALFHSSSIGTRAGSRRERRLDDSAVGKLSVVNFGIHAGADVGCNAGWPISRPTGAFHRQGQQGAGPSHQCQPYSVSIDHRLQFLDGSRTL